MSNLANDRRERVARFQHALRERSAQVAQVLAAAKVLRQEGLVLRQENEALRQQLAEAQTRAAALAADFECFLDEIVAPTEAALLDANCLLAKLLACPLDLPVSAPQEDGDLAAFEAELAAFHRALEIERREQERQRELGKAEYARILEALRLAQGEVKRQRTLLNQLCDEGLVDKAFMGVEIQASEAPIPEFEHE